MDSPNGVVLSVFENASIKVAGRLFALSPKHKQYHRGEKSRGMSAQSLRFHVRGLSEKRYRAEFPGKNNHHMRSNICRLMS